MTRWGLVCLLLLGPVLWLGLAQDNNPETDQAETSTTSPDAQPSEDPTPEDPTPEDPAPEDPSTREDEAPSETAPGEDAAEAREGAPDAEPDNSPEDEVEAPAPVTQRSIPEGENPKGSITLRREERTIIVNQYAPKAEGGEFVLNAPDCGDEDESNELRTTTVYGADTYWVETLVNDTRITSAIALMRKPKDTDLKEQEVLELFGGSLKVSSETKCPEDVQLSEQQDVKLIQGRTTVDGYRFVYDNETGIGKMIDGPVKLNRIAEGASPALNADANELEYNEETDETKLFGEVKLESDGRVSTADSVDFDDANSIATLRGSPARSEKDGDVFEGNVITYFLDSNDVRVEGNIEGTLDVDLGDDNPTTTTAGTEEPQDDFAPEDEFDPNDPFPGESGNDDFDSER